MYILYIFANMTQICVKP